MLTTFLTDATGIHLEVYTKENGDVMCMDARVALYKVSEYFNVSHSSAATMLINASEDSPVIIPGHSFWTEMPLPD